MIDTNFTIPHYKTINQFLQSISSELVAKNPNLYCLKINKSQTNVSSYKPPYKKDFYFISFITNAGSTKINFDASSLTQLNSFLVLQHPGQLYSFTRAASAEGYIIYFTKECFNFFKPAFENEFPFFDALHTNFYKLNTQKYKELEIDFIDLFAAFNNADAHKNVVALKLLTLLYTLKNYTKAQNQIENSFVAPQQILFNKFIQLVNTNYVDKRTVDEYAQMLFVTANHLSQTVKSVSGNNALSFITNRLLSEAKALIQFSDYSIAQIAYQLNFSDPANFNKFFKKHTNQTPLDYRKSPL